MNKKGAALMQVLLIAVILAGISAMLLRANLSTSVSSRKTRRNVSAQMLIDTCMAEVNMLWSMKNEEAIRRDLTEQTNPYMFCKTYSSYSAKCTERSSSYDCNIPIDTDEDGTPDFTYVVQATISKDTTNNKYQIKYEITEGSEYL